MEEPSSADSFGEFITVLYYVVLYYMSVFTQLIPNLSMLQVLFETLKCGKIWLVVTFTMHLLKVAIARKQIHSEGRVDTSNLISVERIFTVVVFVSGGQLR